MLLVLPYCSKIVPFLANRTKYGRAYATVLHLSVVVTYVLWLNSAS